MWQNWECDKISYDKISWCVHVSQWHHVPLTHCSRNHLLDSICFLMNTEGTVLRSRMKQCEETWRKHGRAMVAKATLSISIFRTGYAPCGLRVSRKILPSPLCVNNSWGFFWCWNLLPISTSLNIVFLLGCRCHWTWISLDQLEFVSLCVEWNFSKFNSCNPIDDPSFCVDSVIWDLFKETKYCGCTNYRWKGLSLPF